MILRSISRTSALVLLMALTLGGPGLGESISVEQFEGSEEWPLYRPGELKLDLTGLGTQRIRFDSTSLDGPPDAGRYTESTMYMDVFDAFFKGKPALLIQWTFTASAEAGDVPAIDAVFLDKRTFRILGRVASGPGGPREWLGHLDLFQFHPDRVVHVAVEESGKTELKTLETGDALFEFATLGFLFPLMELKEGMNFRLPGYRIGGNVEVELLIHVSGRTKILDAKGEEHEVWRVEMANQEKVVQCTFHVQREPPFFFGWDFRRVKDGRLLSKLEYVDSTVFP